MLPTNTYAEAQVRRWATLGVGLAAFAAYALGATPTAYPLDSAELASAAFGLGVAHPPGEETTLLVAKAFALLPLGGIAFKVALSQAAAGALAAMLVFALIYEAGSRTRVVRENVGPLVRAVLAAAAALAFAYAPGVVIVSNRPEVYAVQTALSLAALWLGLRASSDGDGRAACVAALCIGLGVGNHSLVAGLVGLGAVAAALPAWLGSGRRGRFAALAVAGFAAGMLVHAYLPLRAAALYDAASVDHVLWGDPRSLHGFWWLVSAKTFVDKAGLVHGYASPGDLPLLLIEELGFVFALIAPAGAYLLLRGRATRTTGAAVVLALAGSLAAAAVGGVDPNNPDIRGYLGPAIAAAGILSGTALTIGLAVFRIERARGFLAALLLAAALARFPSPTAYPGLSQAHAAAFTTRQMLDDLPARAALFTSHYETGFLVGYLRFVEGLRPDLAWAHLGFASGPGYDTRIGATDPELRPALEGYRRGHFVRALLELDRSHAVRIEPEILLTARVRRDFGPAGELWSLAKNTSPEAPLALPAWARAEAAQDAQVRAYLAWRSYADARWSCGLGLSERAALRFAQLEDLVPGDVRFHELERACPATPPAPETPSGE